MKIIEKVFYKDWPDGSRMKVSFMKIGGPIIAEDIVEDSKYTEEIKKDERLFYLKKFDHKLLKVLNRRGFIEIRFPQLRTEEIPSIRD